MLLYILAIGSGRSYTSVTHPSGAAVAIGGHGSDSLDERICDSDDLVGKRRPARVGTHHSTTAYLALNGYDMLGVLNTFGHRPGRSWLVQWRHRADVMLSKPRAMSQPTYVLQIQR
jgi:hypothetical protein